MKKFWKVTLVISVMCLMLAAVSKWLSWPILFYFSLVQPHLAVVIWAVWVLPGRLVEKGEHPLPAAWVGTLVALLTTMLFFSLPHVLYYGIGHWRHAGLLH